MNIPWEDGAMLRVQLQNGAAVVSANRAGLLSLAAQLTALAEATAGSHIHYDEYNSLETGSAELLIEHAAPAED